jgi:hypothetical protein
MISLKNRFYLTTFVETGTNVGVSTQFAAMMFPKVVTIEIDSQRQDQARNRLRQFRNVEFILGDSAAAVPTVASKLEGSALWYLDAHWCGGEKRAAECPLLQELPIIRERLTRGLTDAIVIDNYGMMCHPPHPPHNASDWPTPDQIVEAIRIRPDFPHVQVRIDQLVITVEPIAETL